MALDFEALKKKLEETEKRGGGDLNFWKAQNGRNEIRVLPSPQGGNDFFAEAGTRWNVGPDKKKAYVPVDYDEPCPIREFVDKLSESGDEDDAKLAQSMRYSPRYMFNVVDMSLSEGDEGYGKVQVYDAPTTVFKQIVTLLVDPDYSDLLDPEKGTNVVITRKGTGRNTEYTVTPRRDPSPLIVKDWKDEVADLQALVKPKSYEDRLKILQGISLDSGQDAPPAQPQQSADSYTNAYINQTPPQQTQQTQEVNPWAEEAQQQAQQTQQAPPQQTQQAPPQQTQQAPPQQTPQAQPEQSQAPQQEQQTAPQQPAPQQEPAPASNDNDSVRDEIEALLNRNK